MDSLPQDRVALVQRYARLNEYAVRSSLCMKDFDLNDVRRFVSVAQAEARKAGEIVEDEGEAHEQVIAFLEKLKLI